MNILGHEHAVEDGDFRLDRAPCRAIEADLPTLQQQLDRRRVGRAKGLATENMGRIAGLQGAQDGAERSFAVAVRPGDEGVLGKLRIARCGRVAVPPH
ncbi:hypothetical protein, partial [Mesorhizobium sp. M5C.F.Cr.IN.023.01.1.1]|uniref:hypothetical protein n=1 Tax=Mesorhizobium sp. M5C.F.Cr.IN.023.01.1.1 TaxID=2496768 RepID=UPI0019D215CB